MCLPPKWFLLVDHWDDTFLLELESVAFDSFSFWFAWDRFEKVPGAIFVESKNRIKLCCSFDVFFISLKSQKYFSFSAKLPHISQPYWFSHASMCSVCVCVRLRGNLDVLVALRLLIICLAFSLALWIARVVACPALTMPPGPSPNIRESKM